jgi:hypothetical protein
LSNAQKTVDLERKQVYKEQEKIRVATLSDFCHVISLAAEVELGPLRLIARHLREAGQLPQEGRGLHAAKLGGMHVARLLIGLMVGRKGPIHRVAGSVARIADLRKKTGLRVDPFAAGRKPAEYGDSDTSVVLLPAGASFLDAFTDVLLAFTHIESDVSWHGAVRCVGVKFGAGQAYPWIQLKDDHRRITGLTNVDPGVRRCEFGSNNLRHRIDTGGLLEESQIPNGVLFEIGSLLGSERTADSVANHISFLKQKHQRKSG